MSGVDPSDLDAEDRMEMSVEELARAVDLDSAISSTTTTDRIEQERCPLCLSRGIYARSSSIHSDPELCDYRCDCCGHAFDSEEARYRESEPELIGMDRIEHYDLDPIPDR